MKARRFFALLLIAVIALGLAGCGYSFESAAARAAKELAGVDSVHADLNFDLALTVSYLEESADFDIGLAVSMDTSGELTSGELSMDMLGVPISAPFVVQKQGESYDLYMSIDGGETWVSQTGLSASELESDAGLGLNPDAGYMLGFYLEAASSFGDPVEETVNGVECRRYDGLLPGSRLLEAMSVSGGSAYAEVPEGTVLSDAPMSIWFAKSGGLPVRVHVDMTDAMGEYMTGAMESGGLPADFMTVSAVSITADFADFGTAQPMQPPEL